VTARLDLLAHAATAATRAAAFPDDQPVEPRAFAAIEALGSRLRRYDRVLAAPARAALETAEALGFDARTTDVGASSPLAGEDRGGGSRDRESLASARPLTPTSTIGATPHPGPPPQGGRGRQSAAVEPALRDCDYGRWRGLTPVEVEAREPEAVAMWLSDPGAAPHGGESVADLIGRVGAWLANPGRLEGATLAITHAAVLRAAVVCALGAPPSAYWRIDVAPLTLVRLSGRDGRWNLVSLAPLAEERP
jgi:broad specificity phosphatase PhoE